MKKACGLLVLGLCWGSAYALEPLPPLQVSLDFHVSSEVRPFLHVMNQEDITVLVQITPGLDSTVFFQPVRVSIPSGHFVDIPFSLPEGRQLFDANAALFDLEGRRLRGVRPLVYQPVEIFSDGFGREDTFEQYFLSSRIFTEGDSELADIDLGHYHDISEIGRLRFPSSALPDETYVDPFDLPSPLVFADMPLNQLPDLNDIGVIQPDTGNPGSGDNGTGNDSEPPGTFLSDPGLVIAQARTDLGDPPDPPTDGPLTPPQSFDVPADPTALTIKGHLSLKITDTSYKAAWGWVVRAWQRPLGIWVFLGWTYVNGDGSWQINAPSILPGFPVRIEYRTGNRFVQVQDANANVYTWGDDWNLPPSGTTDIGFRAANLTVNGNLPAVDRIYVGATNVWVKFYNNGMNALRDKPIEITFPNSLASGKCIYGNPPYAWSCSYSADGKIWLIPAHGNATVAQHEIGHSIHSWYWNGSLPPGSGGTHSLTGCYNGGLALTEGFADFLAYWVQFDRTAWHPNAQYLGYDIESPNNGACVGPTNETWVSATFWDMYDYWNDGPGGNRFDSLYYINQAVPVAILLGNKGTNTMPAFLPVVKNGQNAFWQNEFERLFRLDTMIP